MNPERLVREINELLELGDALEKRDRRRGRRHYGAPLRKAAGDDEDQDGDGGDAPSAHAKTKAAHHEKMAELYETISSQHAKMASHYAGGAQGAHHDQGGDEEHDGEADEPQKDDAEDEGDLETLKKKAAAGDVAARLRLVEVGKEAVAKAMRTGHHVGDPSAAGFYLVRARGQGRLP